MCVCVCVSFSPDSEPPAVDEQETEVPVESARPWTVAREPKRLILKEPRPRFGTATVQDESLDLGKRRDAADSLLEYVVTYTTWRTSAR